MGKEKLDYFLEAIEDNEEMVEEGGTSLASYAHNGDVETAGKSILMIDDETAAAIVKTPKELKAKFGGFMMVVGEPINMKVALERKDDKGRVYTSELSDMDQEA